MASNAYIKFNKSRSSASKASLKSSYLVKIDAINPLFHKYAEEQKERIDFLAQIKSYKPSMSALEIYKQRSLKGMKVGQEDPALLENVTTLAKSVAELRRHKNLFKEKQERIDRINVIKQDIQQSGEDLLKQRKTKIAKAETAVEEPEVVAETVEEVVVEEEVVNPLDAVLEEFADNNVIAEDLILQMNAAEDECLAEDNNEDGEDEPDIITIDGKKKRKLSDLGEEFEVDMKPRKMKKSQMVDFKSKEQYIEG